MTEGNGRKPDRAGATPERDSPDPERVVLGGRYVVGQELGRGGMGRVLQATDLKLGRTVAVKLLNARAPDLRQRVRFEQEARAAGGLNHANIVTVHDVGEHAGAPYIVSEMLQGETLGARLRRGPLSAQGTLDLGIQLASGIAAAHERRIVHRDLKPENVFVTREGQLKILDFGIAKLMPGDEEPRPAFTDSGAVIGTPEYMSPEQLKPGSADARSDVFACGALLHEMLTGKSPFDRGNSVETAYAILHDAPPPLKECALSPIVARCLQKAPAARYASGAELLEDLKRLAGGAAISAPKTRRLAPRLAVALALGLTALPLLMRKSPHQAAATRLAVADMANETGEEDFNSLSGMLITALEQSRRLSVIPRSRMLEALHDSGKPDVARIDEGIGRDLARRTSARGLVVANIRRFGDLYVIDLKVLDPERNDEHLLAVRDQGRGKESIPGLIDRLAERVRSRFDEGAADIQAASVPVSRRTTANVEAYRHFFNGEQIYTQKMDWQAAEQEFQEAVRLDPDFALAHLRLAEVSEGASRLHFDRAMQLGDRLSERERCDGGAFRLVLEDRESEALQQWKECADRYPEDEWTVLRAGDWSFHQGDIKSAAAYLGKVRARNSFNAEAYHHLITIWLLEKRFDLVIAAASEQVRQHADAETYDHLAWAKWISGDKAGAEQILQEMERLFPGNPRPFKSRFVAYAHEAEPEKAEALLARPELAMLSTKLDWWRGRYKKVLAKLDAMLAKDPENLGAIWGKAWRLASLGQVPAAGALALQLPTDKSLFLLYCALGNPDAASEMLDSNRLMPLQRSGARLRIAAARAHQQNRTADEIAAYEKLAVGDPAYRSDDLLQLGALYLRVQEPRKAIDVFRRGLETVAGSQLHTLEWQGLGVANRPWNLVTVWYLLASAYDRAGEPSAALEWYRRVLRMWSDADEDIPELIDARARVQALIGGK